MQCTPSYALPRTTIWGQAWERKVELAASRVSKCQNVSVFTEDDCDKHTQNQSDPDNYPSRPAESSPRVSWAEYSVLVATSCFKTLTTCPLRRGSLNSRGGSTQSV